MLNTLRSRLSVMLATFFGIGFCPFAPGTVGSIVAVVCAIPIFLFGGTVALTCSAIIASILGIPISTLAARSMNKKDPGSIVIDEVAGQWITLIPASPNLSSYALGFIAFRFFDILKPGPIGWADRNLDKGLGIMVDDIMAGICAACVVLACQGWLPPLYSF